MRRIWVCAVVDQLIIDHGIAGRSLVGQEFWRDGRVRTEKAVERRVLDGEAIIRSRDTAEVIVLDAVVRDHRFLKTLEERLENSFNFPGAVAVYVGEREERIAGIQYKMTSNVLDFGGGGLSPHIDQVLGVQQYGCCQISPTHSSTMGRSIETIGFVGHPT